MKLQTMKTTLLGLAFALLLGIPIEAHNRVVQVAVAAAGDLREILDEIKTSFEAKHPEIQLQQSELINLIQLVPSEPSWSDQKLWPFSPSMVSAGLTWIGRPFRLLCE